MCLADPAAAKRLRGQPTVVLLDSGRRRTREPAIHIRLCLRVGVPLALGGVPERFRLLLPGAVYRPTIPRAELPASARRLQRGPDVSVCRMQSVNGGLDDRHRRGWLRNARLLQRSLCDLLEPACRSRGYGRRRERRARAVTLRLAETLTTCLGSRHVHDVDVIRADLRVHPDFLVARCLPFHGVTSCAREHHRR